MNAYLVNVIYGLTSFAAVWGGIAAAHHLTCDCTSHQRGRQLNDLARSLPEVS